VIAAIDCSFIPKAGKETYGLGNFYNGSTSKAEQGLEISVIAVIDVDSKQAYSLSVRQTVDKQAKQADKSQQKQESRVDSYLEQLRATKPYLPKQVRYLVGDGFYSKQKWLTGVVAEGLEVIGKLRQDADLRYRYEGEYSGRGRPRLYGAKFKVEDLDSLVKVEGGNWEKLSLQLYTQVVWSKNFQRLIRLVYVHRVTKSGQLGYALLFSTDVNLAPEKIYEYYKMRFQIEFIFRDSKQFTGLKDCQARDGVKLDFHFNSSLSALNVAKLQSRDGEAKESSFSMANQKRLAWNHYLLERFIAELGLDQTLIKSHPQYHKLCQHGLISF
jgi:hypothetical protein